MPGPPKTGYKPSKEKYKCPVKNCTALPRGDDIPKHFLNNANLLVLDQANENQSKLRKTSEDSIEKSEEFLSNLLLTECESTTEHTKYLFQHGYSSLALPNYNSIHFKVQQEKEKAKKRPPPTSIQNYLVPKKLTKSASSDTGTPNVESDSNITIENDQNVTENDQKSMGNDQNLIENDQNLLESDQNLNKNDEIETPTPPLENSTVEFSKDELSSKEILEKSVQNSNLALAVKEALLNPAFIEQFAMRLKETEKSRKSPESGEDFWIEDNQFWICNACLFHSNSKKVPTALLVGKKGNFGYVSKSGKNSHSNRIRHCAKPLHVWCVQAFQEAKEEKVKNDVKNKLAGKKIIRNALLCFKRSLGFETFLALNEKDFLAERDKGNEIFSIATRNDSRSQFFDLRSDVFELLSKKTKQFFNEIQDIAVTLDKVTAQRNSYTVIMTYFFSSGKLYVILNKLQKLSTKDYNAEGTAKMVIETLCETLGYTKSKLSNVLKHFVYDGVYANSEERVSGGGSLELRKYVIKELNLKADDITGD